MKLRRLIALFTLATCAAHAGQLTLAGTDTLPAATVKLNSNFTELYTADTTFALKATTLTIAGTANEITSSAGAQSLAANRTWTLSLPSALTFTGKTVTGGTFAAPVLSGTVTGTYTLGGTPTFPGSMTVGSGTLTVASGKTLTVNQTTTLDRQSSTGLPVEFCVAASDETTALTAGTAKVTFRAPYAFTVTAVRASVNTAPTGSTLIVDINEAGTSILSTKLSLDASEKTSTTAATAAVISDSAIADDAEISIDVDQIGSTVAGAGLKVWILGYR